MLEKFLQKIEGGPFKYSLLFSVVFILLVPINNGVCWDSCQILYKQSFIALLYSGLAIASTVLSVIINFLIITAITFLTILWLRRTAYSSIVSMILILTAGLFIGLSHYLVYYHFTDEGIEERNFKLAVNSAFKELENLKTKTEVIDHIKSQDNYIEVTCENTKLENPVDYLSQLNIFEKGREYNAIYRMKYGGSYSGYGLTKSYFCEVEEKIETNLYHDCIYYIKTVSGENISFNNKICFVNDQTRYIYVNSNTISRKIIEKFKNSYSSNKIITEKNY